MTESGGRSSDGKVINKHFENASHFLIFEVNGGEIQFIEIIENTPLCGSEDNGNKDGVLV
jgi:predicted Fe-Mo cluster-binding NifX family protein